MWEQKEMDAKTREENTEESEEARQSRIMMTPKIKFLMREAIRHLRMNRCEH
jgi:hypothetical protein